MLCIRKGAISPMSLHMCIQKDVISPKSLHIATSDISKGQNWFFVFKKVQHRLCLCICVFKTVQYRLRRLILLHLIYHKDKPGVVYSKRCKYSPMALHIAASDISQGQIKLVLYIQKGAVSS